MQDRSRKSPPQAPAPTESPHLLRELTRSRTALLSLHSAYTYGSILLQRDLPSVAALLAAIARDTEKDAFALGLLLREQGAEHAASMSLRDTSYRLQADADSHAPVVALRLINDRIRDEKNGILHAKALQKKTVSEAARQATLKRIASGEERLALLEEMAARLTGS